MKNLKSVGQCFVALALVFVLLVSVFDTAHAVDGFGGGDRGDFWGDAGIHTGTILTELSYNALSELCILQNDLIVQGVYDDQYPFSDSPYDLSATVRYDSAEGVYVISVSYRGNYYNLRNASGAIYFARYDDGANINSIRLFVTNIFDQVSAFRQKFNSFYSYIGDLTYLGFSAVNEGIGLLDLRLQYLTGYIAGFKDDPTVPSIMSKLDDLIAAVENIYFVGGDGDVYFDVSSITSKLEDVKITIENSSTNIVEAILSLESGSSPIVDAAPIVSALKEFQADFDDTFADLKQIYPTEFTDQISNGQFDWSDINILNSVTATDSSASASIYRLPESNLNITSKGDGLFVLDNYGAALPSGCYLGYDSERHNLNTAASIGTVTYVGKDISFDSYAPNRFVKLVGYGQCIGEGGVPDDYYGELGTPDIFNQVYYHGSFEDTLVPSMKQYYETASGTSVQNISVSFDNGDGFYGYGIPVSSGGNYTDENGQQWLCDVVDFAAGTYTLNVGFVSYWNAWSFALKEWERSGFYVALSDFNPDYLDAEYAGLCDSFEYVKDVNHNNESNGFCYELIDGEYCLVFCHDEFPEFNDFNFWLNTYTVSVYYPCVPVTYEMDSPPVVTCRVGTNRLVANCPLEVTVATEFSYSSISNDADGNWYACRSDGVDIPLSGDDCDALNSAFNYKEYDDVADIKFNAGTNMINVSSGDLTVNYVRGSKFFNWLYLYLSNLNGGTVDIDALLDKLTDIEDALSNISGDVDIDNNLDIDIDSDNDSYNVFYVTDPDTGEDSSIVDLSGNVLTAFGKLLNFLYQIGFGEALNSFGDTVDGLTDFYTGVGDGGADVWAS